MKSVILAGGRGTRLAEAPAGQKAMALLGGRPLLDYALKEVRELDGEALCIVNETERGRYEEVVAAAGANLVATSSHSPCGALSSVISLGETLFVVHADEVCIDCHTELYGLVLERFGKPVVGISSMRTDQRMELYFRRVAQMAIASGGRLSDSKFRGPEPGNLRRYIGRYSLTVDETFLLGLENHESVIEALVYGRHDLVEFNLPKRYFDCGTDARMAESRNRFGGHA